MVGTRLISEQRTERRDDRDKPGIHEVLNHCFNVFVGGRRLLVEQVALATEYAAAQQSLHELVLSEPLAHAQTRLAPSPLTARTMGQRPGSAFAIAQRLDQVAERTTGARDHHGFLFGYDSSLPVNPNGFPFELPGSDAVVATIPEHVSFRSECLSETLSQELAVDLGPAHSQVMTLQVSRSRKRLGIQTAGLMLGNIVTENRLTEPTRTAVNQHDQLLLAQAKLLELASVEDFLDSLEFGEVVSATKSPESFVEIRGLEFLFGENLADFVGPDVLKVERDLSPAVELYVPADQVGL